MTRWNSRFSIFALLVIVLAAAPAFAQQEQGDKSFSGYGSLTFAKAGLSGTYATGVIGATLGVFATKQTELGGSTALFFTSGGGGGTDVFGTVGAYGRQYFLQDRTRPYVGLQVLKPVASGASGFLAQASLGVRQYINRNGSFFIEANYGMSHAEGETIWQDYPGLVFGFAVVF